MSQKQAVNVDSYRIKDPLLRRALQRPEDRPAAETHDSRNRPVRAPLEVFNTAMGRVEGLLLLHPEMRGLAGRRKRHVADMLRGGLVLSVAALDALVLDSVVAAIPRAEKEGTLERTIARWAKADAESFLALLGDREPGKKVAELCRRRLGQPTFHRAEAIEDVIRDVAERNPPWRRAAEILSVDGKVWNDAAVKAKLDEIVEREHVIAYGGDLLPYSATTRRIQLRYVDGAVRVIRAVGSGVAETLA